MDMTQLCNCNIPWPSGEPLFGLLNSYIRELVENLDNAVAVLEHLEKRERRLAFQLAKGRDLLARVLDSYSTISPDLANNINHFLDTGE